jgi:DNA-binding IclR family transcriptional regulator
VWHSPFFSTGHASTEVLVIHHVPRPDGTEQMPETGASLPSHASALGKVLLAFDSEYEKNVLEGPLRVLTGSTITDPRVLAQQLAEIRRSSIGLEVEEAVVSENAAAAPIYDASGNVIAALALVAPSTEWPPSDTAIAELSVACRSISRELGAPFLPVNSAQ